MLFASLARKAAAGQKNPPSRGMFDDTEFRFGDAGPTNEIGLGDVTIMDLLNIATHEAGHAAGLGHPDDSCTEETMYRFASSGETKKRTLHAGDIAGIVDLYK